MTGEPLWGYQAFEDGWAYLKFLAHEVVSPHNLDIEARFTDVVAYWDMDEAHYGQWRREFESVEPTDKFTREAAMRLDITAMLECDAISLLPRWRDSEGARNEVAVARMIGLPIYRHAPWACFETMDSWEYDDLEVGFTACL